VAFLRLGTTRRIVVLAVSALVAIIAVAAVASAAIGGGGSAPPPRPLANALHDALTAPPVSGVTARVDFSTNLFASATTETSSALLKGGSGRLWAAKDKLRIELQSDNGDAQIVVANGKGFVYDGPSNTAYTFAFAGKQKADTKDGADGTVPPLSEIVKKVAQARTHASISQPTPGVVAGQPAYTVRAEPRDRGGLLGAAELAWDAARGVPLRIALYPRGSSTPALQLSVTDINYGSVDDSVFALTPPSGAKVVDLTGSGATTSSDKAAHDGSGTQTLGKLPFTLNDPASLAGRARREEKPAGHDGAVVLYGKGLDTVAVIEHPADHNAAAAPKPANKDGQAVDLPSVSINGAKATAIGTPLGGFVSFDRGGISFTVVGSQPLTVLEAAARGL
jgi:outer membrane lipoprotein-sorting protein